MNFEKKVSCGEFVKRQTKDSGFSHYDGSWEELESMVDEGMNHSALCKPGYRDGVILVELSPSNFYSSLIKLDDKSKLKANYSFRREGENSYIKIAAKGKKQKAKYASVVCYRHDVLAENNEQSTNAEWEIVAIKARVSYEEDPMDPVTMARNFLEMPGGTKGDFSAEDFAKSILYWNTHAMVVGKPKWYRAVMNFFRQLRRDVIENATQHWENFLDIRH